MNTKTPQNETSTLPVKALFIAVTIAVCAVFWWFTSQTRAGGGNIQLKNFFIPFVLSLAVSGVGMFVLDWGLMNLQGISLFFHQ